MFLPLYMLYCAQDWDGDVVMKLTMNLQLFEVAEMPHHVLHTRQLHDRDASIKCI